MGCQHQARHGNDSRAATDSASSYSCCCRCQRQPKPTAVVCGHKQQSRKPELNVQLLLLSKLLQGDPWGHCCSTDSKDAAAAAATCRHTLLYNSCFATTGVTGHLPAAGCVHIRHCSPQAVASMTMQKDCLFKQQRTHKLRSSNAPRSTCAARHTQPPTPSTAAATEVTCRPTPCA